MKKIVFMCGVFFSLALTSCHKDNNAAVDASNKVEGINGNWKLVKVEQVDIFKGILNWTYDVTDMFVLDPANAPMLAFDSNAKTFNMTLNGMRNYFGPTTGSWGFDDDIYPTKVQLTNSGVTSDVALLSAIRKWDTNLKLRFIRPTCQQHQVGYNFIYARQ